MPNQPKTKRLSKRPKLSVYTDREMIKLVRMEKAATDRTMEDIVNNRMRMSYEIHPEPLGARESAPTS